MVFAFVAAFGLGGVAHFNGRPQLQVFRVFGFKTGGLIVVPGVSNPFFIHGTRNSR